MRDAFAEDGRRAQLSSAQDGTEFHVSVVKSSQVVGLSPLLFTGLAPLSLISGVQRNVRQRNTLSVYCLFPGPANFGKPNKFYVLEPRERRLVEVFHAQLWCTFLSKTSCLVPPPVVSARQIHTHTPEQRVTKISNRIDSSATSVCSSRDGFPNSTLFKPAFPRLRSSSQMSILVASQRLASPQFPSFAQDEVFGENSSPAQGF